jgi:UPF0716 protein FxsA
VGCLPLLTLPAVLVAEVYMLIWVAGQVGWGWALLGLLASSAVGGMLVRAAGFATMLRVREALARGEAPGRPLFDGALLLVAGALFAFPGYLTDALGLLLLLPPVRWVLFAWIGSLAVRNRRGPGGMGGPGGAPGPGAGPGRPHVFVWTWGGRGGAGPGRHPAGGPPSGGVIDAEWTEVKDAPPRGTPGALPPGEPDADASGSRRDS